MSQHTADQHEQAAANHLDKAQQIAETTAWMQAEPAMQDWLKQFYDDGRLFVSSYAREQADWRDYGASALRLEHHAEIGLLDEAYRRLWEIQQKKLFHVHCEWRAGRLEVPGVEVEAEFADLGYDIRECSLITPISDDELDLYLAYLASDDCQDMNPAFGGGQISHNWQSYDGFRNWLRAEETGEEPENGGWFGELSGQVCRYPAWYAYYDQYRGTGSYLSLPDVRGPGPYRMPKYVWARSASMATIHAMSLEQEREKAAAEATETSPVTAPPPAAPRSAPAPAPPVLPRLDAYDLTLTETLLKRFENQELLHFMRACEFRDPKTDRLTELASEAAYEMHLVRTPSPIRPSPDWRYSLYVAYLDQRKGQLAALLSGIYADYCQREAAGLPHPALLPHPHRAAEETAD